MTDTGYLDEDDELYGYAVFNVHNDCFVEQLGTTPADREVFGSKDEALAHFQTVADVIDGNTRHLRLVRVVLDNDLDERAAEQLQTTNE